MTQDKEIIITTAWRSPDFIGFYLKGLKDGVLVGSFTKNGKKGLSVAFRGEVVFVPFDADTEEIKKINEE